jgi:hypothetical protein
MPLFNQEIRSKQSTRTKVGRVIRAEGGFVDVVAVGGNTVFSKVKTGGLSPNVGDYVTLVFHSDGEKQAIPISSKEATSGVSSVSSVGSSGGGGGSFVAGNGLSTTIGGITNVNTVAGRTQITSNAIDVNTSLLPTPLVGEIGRVAYVSATGQLSYSSSLSLDGVQIVLSGTANRIVGDFNNATASSRVLFRSASGTSTIVGAVPFSTSQAYFMAFGLPDPDNTHLAFFGASGSYTYLASNKNGSGTTVPMLIQMDGVEKARIQVSGAFLFGKSTQALPDSSGNVEINDSLWIGNLLKVAGATSGLATIRAAATVTPTLTLPSVTGTVALTSDISTAVSSAVSGTSGNIAKFTAANAVGNSLIKESGSAIFWTGTLKLKGAGAGYNIFSPPNIGADITHTLPSVSGTLAQTADITTAVSSAVSGTLDFIPIFTGSNSIGNSPLLHTYGLIASTTTDLGFADIRTGSEALITITSEAQTSTWNSYVQLWAKDSDGGSAKILLSSLLGAGNSLITFNVKIVPETDGVTDIGRSDLRWRDTHQKGSINIYGATSGNASIVVPAVSGTPTLTLPTTTGTLALTSDIPAPYTHPNHSGDATSVGSGAITFATVNSNVGTFGSTTQSVQVTVNGKGLITAISNQTIAFPLSGSGTTNYLVKWTGATALGNSALLVTTNTIENNTADTGLKTTRLASNAQLTIQAFAVNTSYVSSVIAVANDGDGGQAQFSLFSGGSAAASYIQLQGKIEFTSNDTYDIGATSAPRNILADRYMWAKKTLNAGSGANRNSAYSLDIKEPDVSLSTPTGSWVFIYDGMSSVPNDHNHQLIRIWAYKTVGGRKIFSSGYLELSDYDNGLGGNSYHLSVTLGSVSGADGYYIRLIDEEFNWGTGITNYAATTLSASGGTFLYDPGNSFDSIGFDYIPVDIVTPTSAATDVTVASNALNITGPIVLSGLTSGQINLWATDVAGNNIIYLPAASGTLALLSDIPTSITGSGTSGTLTKWTGTSSLGNSILSESGTVLSLAGSAQITLTTEQMRWRYNSSNWMALTINSSGNPAFTYSSSSPAWDFGYTNFKFKQENTPAAPTVADSGVAGNPNGTYRYKIVFVTALGNTGSYANLSSQIVVASKQIDLSSIPVGTTGVVTSRQIYRNATGSNIYKLVATIADNTTTTYRDNVADGSLGGTIAAFNTTGAKFSTGAAGTTDVMWLHPAGVIVSALSIGSGTLPGGYLTWPYNQNIQSMNSTGDGFVNVLGVGASGINFGAGFSMGNQGVTNLYSLTFYATARISSSAGGGNYDIEFNNSAGGTGKLKWFGSSGNYYMNLLDSASGGYAGFGTNLTPTSKLHVDGAFARNGAAKSSNFTVDVNASAYYVTTGSGADITATLVVASTCNGREYIFVKVDSGTKDIIITRAGSDTINGATTLNVGTTQWSRATIKSDGTNWVRIA